LTEASKKSADQDFSCTEVQKQVKWKLRDKGNVILKVQDMVILQLKKIA
jgi:hypothetical protein